MTDDLTDSLVRLSPIQEFLIERFGVTQLAQGLSVRRDGRKFYLGPWACSPSSIYVIGERSRLEVGDLDELLSALREFWCFLAEPPLFRDKKLYGILAAVDIPDEIARKALGAGVYLAHIHDEEFQLQVPPGFQPRAF